MTDKCDCRCPKGYKYDCIYSSPPLIGPQPWFDHPAYDHSYQPPSRNLFSLETLPESKVFLPEEYFGPFIETDSDESVPIKTLSGPLDGGDGGDAPVVDSLQKTSNYSVISEVGSLCYASMTTGDHSPDAHSWLSSPTWPIWDGSTTFSPCGATPAQIVSFVWPSSNPWQMRGLRQMFYDDPPFVNNSSPTIPEIELWHLRVIRLYRDLLGVSLGIMSSRELYLRSHWNDERKFSTYWDTLYPGTLGSSYGPCIGSYKPKNPHCGASFLPSCPQQTPYLRSGEPCIIDSGAGSEGIFGGDQDWPWCVKLSRILRLIVQSEGITGHGGPFLSRPYVGMSFRCHPTNGTFTVRIKWNGTQVSPC